MLYRRVLALLILGFTSCSNLEETEQLKIRKKQLKVDPIVRLHDEEVFKIEALVPKPRKSYPFEPSIIPQITKEYFRCRGKVDHPVHILKLKAGESQALYDCNGIDMHSLPIREDEEFIYPVLITLLNSIQRSLQKKVVITSGHRCPDHALYLDPDKKLPKARHMMGAGVDFYVDGYETKPEAILDLIKDLYKQESDPTLQKFHQIAKDVTCWSNKEIQVTLYQKNQGRDLDNQHPYPYLSIEVKVDRATKKTVEPNWKLTHESYHRW